MIFRSLFGSVLVLAAVAPLGASVTITSFLPSLRSPQNLGTPVTFIAKASDSGSGPLAFQFSVSFNGGPYTTVQGFRGYPLEAGAASDIFVWGAALTEGSYSIQVTVEDFTSGQSAARTLNYKLNAIASGPNLVLTATSNPLVVLASGPSCPSGSSFSVEYRVAGTVAANYTNPIACDGTHSMNQYVTGLYADSSYKMDSVVSTGTTQVFGSTGASTSTASLPIGTTSFPPTKVITAAGAGVDPSIKNVLFSTYGSDEASSVFLPIMTDLSGNVQWYAALSDPFSSSVMTRLLPGGNLMAIRYGDVWNGSGNLNKGAASAGQTVEIIDPAGYLVQSTTTQAVAEALMSLGYAGTSHCSTVPTPVSIGTQCLASFNHEFLQLPDGNYLVLVEQESIFPPGTQGNTTTCTVSGSSVGCNVDIVGNCIVILDGTTLQPLWFWSPFEHDGAAELPITRPAINIGADVNNLCNDSGAGCAPIWLAGTTGVTVYANDWLHFNSAYYRQADGNLIISLRHQDWVALVQYQNGAGNGDVLWRLGCSPGLTPPVSPVCGDFTFNNVYNDVYPWFSHQHDVEIDANGDMTMYDNGNTRVYELGNSQNSRGYVINVNEVNFTVSPVLIQNLGYQSDALGSAQLLPDGNYFFQASDIIYASGVKVHDAPTHALEVQPTTGESGDILFDLKTTISYRGFGLPNLYDSFVQ